MHKKKKSKQEGKRDNERDISIKKKGVNEIQKRGLESRDGECTEWILN